MTSPSLIERLEGAERGSRELDYEIHDALFGPVAHNPDLPRRDGWGPGLRPMFTTSLDAALALAERLGLSVVSILTLAAFFAGQNSEKPTVGDIARYACIAILRARKDTQ